MQPHPPKKYRNFNVNIATWNQNTLHTDIFFDKVLQGAVVH